VRFSSIQPGQSRVRIEIARLTQVVAKDLNRPGANAHIFYQPDDTGQVAFEGKLVR
jgi:hypothetical protein